MKSIMLMKWDGVTQQQYDQIRKSVNWEGNHPKGSVFHVAGFSNNCLQVTDIWESPEDFNEFVQNRLTPGVAAAGIKGAPQVEFVPVHAIFVPSAQKLVP